MTRNVSVTVYDNSFVERIQQMNRTFHLECNDKPSDLGFRRLLGAYKNLVNEATEILECTDDETLKDDVLSGEGVDIFLEYENDIDNLIECYEPNPEVNLVALADVLGDLVVYAFSEAARWGIPLTDVLHIIMDSQDSKLVDGKPVMSPDGSKFIKGPNYQPPEERIRALLETQ